MFKNATRIPPAVYGHAVTHTAPSRAGMVQPLLWQPSEPQYRPTAVESMSSRAGDKGRAQTQAHFLAAVSMARIQLIKLRTQWDVWSAEFVL